MELQQPNFTCNCFGEDILFDLNVTSISDNGRDGRNSRPGKRLPPIRGLGRTSGKF